MIGLRTVLCPRDVWLAAAVLILSAAPACGLTLLFEENFDTIPLGTATSYGSANGIPNVISQDLPGWDILNEIPGETAPNIGVPEWTGWSFADEAFWRAVGGFYGDRIGRQTFFRGQNTIAVADPDQWNTPQLGFGDPANQFGFYNSFLRTPVIDLQPRDFQDTRLTLAFDTSWRGECCDDGRALDDTLVNQNNQTAIVRIRVDGGNWEEVLRWESAPFFDGQGRPSREPFDPSGNANTQNANFVDYELNERVFITLNDLIGGSNFALLTDGEGFAAAASAGGVEVEFGMENAGDDGWWAIDNVQMLSSGELFGDMNLNGMLDVGDYDAFALGMLDTYAYRLDYAGAFPVENGSLDSVFDFDDIPNFLAVMKEVGMPATAFSIAFFGIPEPSTLALLGLAVSGLSALRPRWQ